MTDVFDQNTQTNTVAPANSDVFKDKLLSIKGKDGQPKYDTVEKALDALTHAQTHIERLETENSQNRAEQEALRVRAAQADALEQVIERLQPNNRTQEQPKTPAATGLSEQATIEALEQIISKRDQAKVMQDNLTAVQSTLIKKFGTEEGARTAVATKAAELGITTQELAALASKSPKAVLTYFGETQISVQPVTPSQTAPLSTPNTDEPLKPPQKSLLRGSTLREQTEYMKKVKDEIYKRHNIEV